MKKEKKENGRSQNPSFSFIFFKLPRTLKPINFTVVLTLVVILLVVWCIASGGSIVLVLFYSLSCSIVSILSLFFFTFSLFLLGFGSHPRDFVSRRSAPR